MTPNGLPGAPTGVTATAGNGQATVSWTTPTNNGGDLLAYRFIRTLTTATMAISAATPMKTPAWSAPTASCCGRAPGMPCTRSSRRKPALCRRYRPWPSPAAAEALDAEPAGITPVSSGGALTAGFRSSDTTAPSDGDGRHSQRYRIYA